MRKCLIILAAVVALTALCINLFSQEYAVQNGDVNMDGQVCMDDSIQVIYHLWRDGRELPCPDAADMDRSGVVDVGDVILGLRHVFMGDVLPDCPISCYPGY